MNNLLIELTLIGLTFMCTFLKINWVKWNQETILLFTPKRVDLNNL